LISMSDIAIRVEGLGKCYRLGAVRENGGRHRYKSLRDSLANAASAPFRALRLSTTTSRTHRRGADDTFWALQDISFEIKRGEVVGIIGRNGAGKSTLLKILSQITEPTTGRAQIRGRVACLLEVGTGFHPELTGRENIYLNGAILGMKRAEIRRKFDEIVAFAEVERFLDTPVKHYSSGMHVRLAFAVAAHLEQEILIVDEVLAVGDAQFQKKCLNKMHDVSRGGRTVLFVSHNIGAVQSLCGLGLVLDRGRMREIVPVQVAVSEYSASLRQARSVNDDALPALGPALHLDQLECGPDSIISGGPMSLKVKLVSETATVIKEIAALIYSDYGVRVAVLDLRRDGLHNVALTRNCLEFEVNIEKLPLVEGDYRVGLYLVTRDYSGDYLDLASFSVAASSRLEQSVPFPARYRGFVELEFSTNKLTAAAGGAG
jgi:lipopolysaccharide transport system ATP-binding protein